MRHIPNRLDRRQLNNILLSGLEDAVAWHSGIESKPIEIDLCKPYPVRLRVYLYNATYPPGGRSLGERKIQIKLPAQPMTERGNFDHSNGRIVLLAGYEEDIDVFVLWDAGTYMNFPFNMNLQVAASKIYEAFSGKIAIQKRRRKIPKIFEEAIICCPRNRILQSIEIRIKTSLERMIGS